MADVSSVNNYSSLINALTSSSTTSSSGELTTDGFFKLLAAQLQNQDMPNMDGLEALKLIKAKAPNAAVVMCSAMGQESMVIEAIKSGAKDFIVKPFKPDRILKTVTGIIG